MIYLVVGPSHAGKTSFVYNTFMRGKKCVLRRDLIYLTETDDCVLIGNYTIDRRSRGTDTVARQQVKLIGPQIKNILAISSKDIVLDGDKICSHKLFDEMLSLDVPCKLYYIACTLETSIARNKKFNSTCPESTLKRTFTKARNIYRDYYDKMDGEMVFTDNIIDFTQFNRETANFISGYPQQNLFNPVDKTANM